MESRVTRLLPAPWTGPSALTLSPDRPQGKSYLYFTQFKAEVRGAEIEYAMAYVSTSLRDPRTAGACGAPDSVPGKGLRHAAALLIPSSHLSWRLSRGSQWGP